MFKLPQVAKSKKQPHLPNQSRTESVPIMGFGARSKKGKKKNKIYINNNSQINNKIDKGAKEYINNKRRKKQKST